MKIAVIGISHQKAPIAIREKLALTDSQKMSLLDEILGLGITEAVILATCNRSEVYIVSPQLSDRVDDVVALLEGHSQVAHLEQYLFRLEGREALSHLFHVSAGLDSLIIGEDQILGQVREAHQLAMMVGATGKILNKCFREAITTAKKIKSDLRISHYPLSMSSIGVKYMEEKMGTLKGKCVLLIGMGKMTELTLPYLLDGQVASIYLTNRTRHKAILWQEKYPGICVISYEDLYEYLPCMDLVISATASPHLILRRGQMPDLKRNLYLLDMALPRDIDQEIGTLEKVHLYNMDALYQIAQDNNSRRCALAKEAESFIEEGLEAFSKWAKRMPVDSTIQSLQERCEVISQDTMDYLKRKLALGGREEKLIEKMLISAMHRLMREPIHKLKEIEDTMTQKAYIEVVEDLFDL